MRKVKTAPSLGASFLCLLFSLSVYSQAVAQTNVDNFAITNVTVIDGTGNQPMENATVTVKDGKIDCVGDCQVKGEMRVINGKGKFLIPGLVDAHVHYVSGWIDSYPGLFVDVNDRYPYEEVLDDLKEHPERFHQSYLCSGVTAVFDVGGFPWVFDIREGARNSKSAPHYLTTGPIVTMKKTIVPHPAADDISFYVANKSEAVKAMDFLEEKKADGVNLHRFDLAENEKILEDQLNYIVQRANQADIRTMAFAKTLESAKSVLRAGVNMLVYSIEDKVVDEEFLALAKRNDLIYVPTLGVSQGFAAVAKRDFPEDRISLDCIDPVTREKVLRTDSLPYKEKENQNADEGEDTIAPGEGEKTDNVRTENLRKIHAAGITIATGSSAGAPLTLHGPGTHNEMIAMVEAGLTPMEVLTASTKNGAKALGRDDFGTIKKGKIADIVLLDKNPLENISNIKDSKIVIRGGKIW